MDHLKNLESLKNIQDRMTVCINHNRNGTEVPSWDKIKEDLMAFQKIREVLWDAQEGINAEQRTSIMEAVESFLDACVEKGQNG